MTKDSHLERNVNPAPKKQGDSKEIQSPLHQAHLAFCQLQTRGRIICAVTLIKKKKGRNKRNIEEKNK